MSLILVAVGFLFLAAAFLSPFNRRAHAFVCGGVQFLRSIIEAGVDTLDHGVPRGAAWLGAAVVAVLGVLVLVLAVLSF
jgi:hypothetical protein